MARIRTYGLDSSIDPADKIIGTDGTIGPNQGDTKNFSVSALTSYISGEIGNGTLNTIPMWTPDGNTLGDSIITTDTTLPVETDGIVVNGKFRVEVPAGTDAFGVSNEVVSHINARFNAGIIDSNSSLGTADQVLTSTGTSVSWVDVSSLAGNVSGSGTLNTIPIWTPDGNTLGDSVLTYDAPNTLITLTGKLIVTSTTNFQGNLTTEAGLTVNTTLADGSGSFGTSGQILSSTGTATQWVDGIPSNNITGSGTLDRIPIFTPDGQTIGDSDIIRTGLNTYQLNNSLTVPTNLTTTNFYVSNIFAGDSSYVGMSGSVQIGNEDTDTLIVTSTSTFNNNVTLGGDNSDDIVVEGTLELQGPVKDQTSTLGADGQILISDASGNLTFQDQTTYTYSSAQDGSDVVLTLTDGTTPQDVQIVAGNSISLTDNGNNEFTIAATGGAANTTYDLNAGISQSGNGKIRLLGSDATTDVVTIIPGNNIVITSPNPDELNIATASDVVTGSGTLNTIPLWTPSGAELGDSSVTLNAQGGVIINTNPYGDPGSTDELTVQGLGSTVVIESLSAGNAYLEFKPNVTSNHQGVFKLTDSGSQYDRAFTWTDYTSGELMRLNGHTGNLGLDVTNPTSKLHVNSTSAFKAETGGQTYFQLFYANNTGYINTGTSGETINLGAPGGNITNLYVQGHVMPQYGIRDVNTSIGNSGQILSSTGTSVEWIDNTNLVAGTDISISQVGNEYTINSTATLLNTTYDLTGATNNGNYDITLSGSDGVNDSVKLAAGTNITLTSGGTNVVTIETLDHIATREQNPALNPLNGVIPVMSADDSTIGGLYYSGITTYQGGLIMPGFSITGDIRGDVNVDGTVSATDFIFTTGFPFYTEIGSISDFEEGTWTPDIKTYLTNVLNPVAGLQFDTQLGTYIKVNDKVFCEFKIRYKLQATYDWPANEYLVITGLPFTPEGSIRNSNLSGNINRLSSFNSTNADELPRLLSNASSPFYDVVIPTGMGLLPPQNTNSGTKPLLASLFSDQDDYTGGNYVEFYGSFTYTTA